ncbi:MAG: DNA polymerase III subunit delta' [Deltaproteobacteria bacterium]|nr:DNA polymerase III subunit delta' [Deltaproteobacteria bacterium]
MSFAAIRGQTRAVDALRRALARGRLPHALIFAGPAGVGKRATAYALAAAALCTEQPGVGCGRCEDCRLVAAGTHPDLVVEDLERARAERPTAMLLSIEQARRVRSHLAMRAVRGGRKIAIIDQAERLTVDAQNALLKTLEEPPGRATLVLIATNADALLATIRSRCQRLLFAPLEPDLLRELLEAEGIDPELAGRAVALAEGSLDRARTLADEEGLAQADELRAKLDRLRKMRLVDVLDLAGELAGPRGEKGRAQQEVNVATVLSWCRAELARAAADAAAATDPDDVHERLEAVRAALRRAERSYATSRELERNANVHLAWDRLLLELRE